MKQVFEIGLDVIYKIRDTQSDVLQEAGIRMAQAFMNDHSFFVTGSGHSHTVAEEFYGRAGGLAFVKPILTNELTITEHPTKSTFIERLPGYAKILIDLYHVQKDDVVLVASNSGRNAYPIEMALEAKALGATVIAITNVTHSKQVEPRHPSGKRLMDIADIVIDNCGAMGDCALQLDGMDAKVCPTSSMANSFIAQAINVACMEELLKNDIKPPVFVSLNLDGNEDVNEVLFQKYTRLY